MRSAIAGLVLIGEASHGTHEFYRTRAELTKLLVRQKGFNVIAVEADWPDAYRVNRWVRHAAPEASAEAALDDVTRFPRWMWRNRRDAPVRRAWCARRSGATRDQLVPASSEGGIGVSMRDIPLAEWQPFLDQFSREHRAWLVTVERANPGGRHHVEVVERPLRSVTADTAGGRIVGIQIQFHQDSHVTEAVRIDAPTRLSVDETQEGAAQALEIEDTNGACIRIQFRVAVPPGMLDGLAPGEL